MGAPPIASPMPATAPAPTPQTASPMPAVSATAQAPSPAKPNNPLGSGPPTGGMHQSQGAGFQWPSFPAKPNNPLGQFAPQHAQQTPSLLTGNLTNLTNILKILGLA